MAVTSRRRSRIAALQALYEADLTGRDVAEVLERQLDEAAMAGDARAFTEHLVAGVTGRRDAIDEVIRRHAPAFPLEDMPPIDRNVLRLAIYEVLFDNRGAPLRVAINEAVDIAKGYGSESSGRFVNGVLGAVALRASERDDAHGEASPGDEPPDDDPGHRLA